MIKKLFFTAIVCFSNFALISQNNNYSLHFKVNGLMDTVVYLAGYYGDRNTVVDTAYPKQGKFEFEGKNELPGGIYFLVDQDKSKLFEFIVDRDQNFTIKTDTISFIHNLKIRGSNENELFFNYVQLSESLHQHAGEIRRKMQAEAAESERNNYNNTLKEINDSINQFKQQFVVNHPDHLMTLIFNALQQPDIPDTLDQSNPDFKRIQYQLYKNNYWNNVPLHDPRIIRTPVFQNKLKTFFDKIVYQHPDSLTNEIDRVLAKTDTSDIVFNYLIWHFIEQYDQEEVMGMDKIFVHLAKTYFGDSTRVITSESILNKIRKRADQIAPLLIGEPAPNMILLDTNDRFYSFYNIESDFIILFFYDFDCGVCKQEIRILKPLIDTIPLNVEVFAVCTDTNLKKWRKKIYEYDISDWANVNATRSITENYHDLYDVYATPMIYVLNRKREIIAKKIAVNQLYQFLIHYNRKNE